MAHETPAARAWNAMTPEQRAARLAALSAGRRAARSPEARAAKIVELEEKIDRLNAEFRSLRRGDPRRVEIIRNLRPMMHRLANLQWGERGGHDELA